MNYIQRSIETRLLQAMKAYKAVLVTGPRQARQIHAAQAALSRAANMYRWTIHSWKSKPTKTVPRS